MRRKYACLLIALMLTMLPPLSYSVRADGIGSDNIYKLGSISPADLSAWHPLGAAELHLSAEGKPDPYFTLEATADWGKTGNGPQRLSRSGLNLPVPRELRFQASVTNAILSVVLRDSSGHQFVSPATLAPKPGEWSEVSVPLGESASQLHNLDSIAILFTQAQGLNSPPAPVIGRFSNFECVYPTGTGPRSAELTRPELEKMLAPLDVEIPRMESLLPQATAAGAETRYFRVSLTVLKRYRREVLDMSVPGDPLLATRTANYLLECAARTERGLREAIKHPKASIHVPQVSLSNLTVRGGSYYSGKRPVFLLGVCGWFDARRFDDLADNGFTVAAGEIGPSLVFPTEDKTDTAALQAYGSVLDAAAKRNMTFDLLLSPHYMPGWAYQKWPDLDPTDRRHNNPFMPWDVRSPHLREIMARYLSTVIPALKDKPALLDYDLINEAWYGPLDVDSATLAEYRASGVVGNDWDIRQLYTTPQVSAFVQWYYNEVRKYDDAHSVYIKVLGQGEVLCIDREALGDILNANGMDCYPHYPDLSGGLAVDMSSVLLRLDFHRSLTPDKPILDGEYHVFGGTYDYPENYVRAALWAAALHGQDAASLWTADRADGASVAWHANGMEILGHTALDFLRLGPEVQAFQRQQTPVAIFYDWTRMQEAYQVLLFQDRDVNILTDKRIQQGALSRCKILVLPGGSSPNATSARRITQFAKAGGIVVRCKQGVSALDLYPVIRAAVAQAHCPALVRADTWGVECRSVVLGRRKLFYLINYRRQAVDVQPKSPWNLERVIDLRTKSRLDGKKITLQPLEFKILEAVPSADAQ